MSLFRGVIIIATIFGLLLGITAVNGQVTAEKPQFKSGASVMMGIPVDFNILSQRVGAIYDVVESNDSHIVWKFTGTTGDWAFVFADGRIIVASTVDFNLDAKDTLTKEINDVMDMLNSVFAGIVSDEARNNALDSAVYYASEPEIYHSLKYNFDNSIELTFVVPDCKVKKARLTVSGDECGYSGEPNPIQKYFVDGKEVSSCSYSKSLCCSTQPTDITDKIPPGFHKITSQNSVEKHTMLIEIITTYMPPKKFVLYGPNYIPMINETGQSLTLGDLNSLIAGNIINTTA